MYVRGTLDCCWCRILVYMSIPDEDMKKILACLIRLLYSQSVRTEKDQQVIEIINRLIGDDNVKY